MCIRDRPGAYPGLEAEKRGQGEAIARNIIEMTRLKTPIICVIIGEGASGNNESIAIGQGVAVGNNELGIGEIALPTTGWENQTYYLPIKIKNSNGQMVQYYIKLWT